MIKRIFQSILKEMLSVFPVVAVVGSRQVGKSTLVRQTEIGDHRKYVTLDDLATRGTAQRDPNALLSTDSELTIDEVQLAPDLLRCIKQRVDTDRQPGRYLLTGSAELNYCADLSHILAGRVGILRLPPITWSEIHGSGGTFWNIWLNAESADELEAKLNGSNLPQFEPERILAGGFPLSITATTESERKMWMESFRSTYLERDLRRISDISHLSDFSRLMELSAVRTGNLLNQSELARDAGLNSATAGRYFSILEASFLIHRLPPFFINIGKRLVKSPKLYWEDTGLASYLLGISSVASLDGNRMEGALFETFAMMEIRALLPVFAPSARLFFVRTHTELEIDGLLQVGQSCFPFEIKSSQTVRVGDADPLVRWIELNPDHGPGVIFYRGAEVKRLTSKVVALPIGVFLL